MSGWNGHWSISLQTIRTPNQNFFRVQTRRLTTSFEPLNSSLLISAPELRTRKAICDPVVLAQKSLKPIGRQSVKALPADLEVTCSCKSTLL